MHTDATTIVAWTAALSLALGLLSAALRRCEVKQKKHEKATGVIEAFSQEMEGASYTPTPYLFNGLLQTATAEMPSWVDIPPYMHELVALPEVRFEGKTGMTCCPDVIPAGVVELDWVTTDNAGPVVLIAPGLTGSSESPYVKRLIEVLMTSNRRYRPVVYVPRLRAPHTCGGDKPFFYSCGFTHDFRRAVHHVETGLRQKAEEAGSSDVLLGIGFSMGANVLAKYAGEEGERSPFRAFCCLSAPLDCPSLCRYFKKDPVCRYFLDPFLTGCLQKIRENIDEELIDTDHPKLEMDKVKAAKTVTDYDDNFTAPLMGCTSAQELYDQASCHHLVEHIKSPAMFLHAENDPIVPAVSIPRDVHTKNPNLVFLSTTHGGHSMGWPTGPTGYTWSSDLCLRFFESALGEE
ncbi:putative esterase [Diplonema papillatum]|nr:putative esterase [Diplonema papillatum]